MLSRLRFELGDWDSPGLDAPLGLAQKLIGCGGSKNNSARRATTIGPLRLGF
jgi:hypothetical protein